MRASLLFHTTVTHSLGLRLYSPVIIHTRETTMPDHDDDKNKGKATAQNPKPPRKRGLEEGAYTGVYGEYLKSGFSEAKSTFEGVEFQSQQRIKNLELGLSNTKVSENSTREIRLGYQSKSIDAQSAIPQKTTVTTDNPNMPNGGSSSTTTTTSSTNYNDMSNIRFQGGVVSVKQDFNTSGAISPFVSVKAGAGQVSSSIKSTDLRTALAGLSTPVEYSNTTNKGFGGIARAEVGLNDGRFIPGVKAHYEVIQGMGKNNKGTTAQEIGADVFKNINLNKKGNIVLHLDAGASVTTSDIDSGLKTKGTKPNFTGSAGLGFKF